MSVKIVESMKAHIDKSDQLLEKFIETCPDDFWESVWGNYAVYQQVYHAISVAILFNPVETDETVEVDISREEASLQTVATKPVSKEKMREFFAFAKKMTAAYLASLTDETLADANPKVQKLMKVDWSHAQTLMTFSSHLQYHVGVFDAGLRERKLPGVF
jgi:uncharacterized protein YjaG (DUF416 family)